METTTKIICITCPKGCSLEVTHDGQTVIKVGEGCKRGKEYVQRELTDPRRMVATTVRVKGGRHPLLPVATTAPFPKPLIFNLMAELRTVEARITGQDGPGCAVQRAWNRDRCDCQPGSVDSCWYFRSLTDIVFLSKSGILKVWTRVDSDAPTYDQLLAEVNRLRQRWLTLNRPKPSCRRTANALRESEEKYRNLLDDSSDPIFSFNQEGQYQYVNRAFADGVGKKAEEIIYKKIWDVFPQDEADKRFAAVKWVIAHGETKVIEVRVPREDGDRFYITTVKPVFDDRHQVASVICISKEITERKRMEEELLRLSTHDILTNLYNRNFFEVEMDRIQMSRLFPVSIVVADMDKLKIDQRPFWTRRGRPDDPENSGSAAEIISSRGYCGAHRRR